MTERVEKQLGNYRLRHLVGIGAFADVYLGTHIYLNSRVAIKILHTHLDELTIEGFRNEARHLSHLAHPHIIRVLDFGIEDEIPFLVMDYAPRGNLRQRHPQGDVVPLLTVLSYVNTIAAALQYTHDQHLIHRDLKPENLLVGEQGEILLSDFGLALIASGLEPLRVQEHLGTLAYMAPEQIAGHVCPASDQFALAVMAFEWLSGRHPFAGYGGELVNQQLFDSIAPQCVSHAEIPPAVEQVLFRALAKDPAQRFADDLSFAHALDEASQPISPLAFMPGQPAVASTQTEAVRPGLASSLGYIENLPLPLTPLLGRERELQLAHTRLLRPEVRLRR